MRSSRAPRPAPAAAAACRWSPTCSRPQIKAAGKKVNNALCEHFACTRQELFEIVKIKRIKTFDDLIASHGQGHGCEICKPAVASILASLWNENVVDHTTIQDTNDRFLANIQRGGTYSVVPRVPGGEITPDKLIVLGQVAKKYGLYTKITGGQRVDLFGAPVHQLPDIWEELVNAGFESGHAYGKALRTVKSCVGTTWCRFGVQDSVGFADPRREPLQGLPRAAQAQGGRLRLRPRVRRGPVARTSASSPPKRAGTSTSAATAAPSRATPTCSPPTSTRRPASSTSIAS